MGFYDLGTRAAIVLRSLASVLLAVLVPFGTQEHLEGGTEGISRLHRLSLKYTALFVLCGSVIAFYFSRELVEVWLGRSAGVDSVLFIFRVFLAVHAIGALAGPSAMLGRAAGTPLPETVSSILAMALGLAGAVAARSFSMAVLFFALAMAGASLALWIILTKRLRLGETGWREVAKVAGIAVASLLTVIAVDLVLRRWNTGPAGRIAVGSGAALAAAALLAWTSRVLSPSERDFWIGLAGSGGRSGEIASSGDSRTSP
jgi:O-antigen/teichoic acid export membrane protein